MAGTVVGAGVQGDRRGGRSIGIHRLVGYRGHAVQGVVAVGRRWPNEDAGAVGVAAGDDGAAGLVVASQLLGCDLLAIAGVAGAVAIQVIRQDVALGGD